MILPNSTLFTVGDAYVEPGKGVVVGGVNPGIRLDSPKEFESLAGRDVEIRQADGGVIRTKVLAGKAVTSISGAFNFFLLVDIAMVDRLDRLKGAEVALVGMP